jgi:8-oxo-dGTP pyrophosphatase MutT (NUDIX family)
MVTVVVGIVDLDGSILIAQRNSGDRLAFTWEFPGGNGEADAPPLRYYVTHSQFELLGINTALNIRFAGTVRQDASRHH